MVRQTLTCFKCRQTQYELQQCRKFSSGKLIWFYKCPDLDCSHEVGAYENDFSPAPSVASLAPAEEDDTSLGGVVVPAPYDILAANPVEDEHGVRLYWGAN